MFENCKDYIVLSLCAGIKSIVCTNLEKMAEKIIACELPNFLLLYFVLSVSSTVSMGPILTLLTLECPSTSRLHTHWTLAHYGLINMLINANQ